MNVEQHQAAADPQTGALKMQDRKKQDRKMSDKLSGVKNAGLKNNRLEFDRQENEGQQSRTNAVENHLQIIYLQRKTTQQCEQEGWLPPTKRASAAKIN